MAPVTHARKIRRRELKAERQRLRRINVLGRVPDKWWAVFQKYLPPQPVNDRRGRPMVPFRQVLGGSVYRLRTGGQWNALPTEFGSGSTCHRRFQEWQTLNLFEHVWAEPVRTYDQKCGMAWNGQSLDRAILPAPWGGEKTGKNPTDRAKLGSQRHLWVDRRGVP